MSALPRPTAERDGVVERHPDPGDRRTTLVSLTRKARARFPKAKTALLDAASQSTRGLTADERAQLVALLRRVVANLEDGPPE